MDNIETVKCPRCGNNAVRETFRKEQETSCFHCAYHYKVDLDTEISEETFGAGVFHIVHNEERSIEEIYLCLTKEELKEKLILFHKGYFQAPVEKAYYTEYLNSAVNRVEV
jgi:hypothetical protein